MDKSYFMSLLKRLSAWIPNNRDGSIFRVEFKCHSGIPNYCRSSSSPLSSQSPYSKWGNYDWVGRKSRTYITEGKEFVNNLTLDGDEDEMNGRGGFPIPVDCEGGGSSSSSSSNGVSSTMGKTRTNQRSTRYYVIFVLALILGMCQVSEECPAVCECKWKSGKESVICANAKTKLTEIPSGLDPGTQVLDLSGNSIKTLPANVFLSLNLLNLQKIFLSECSLKSLDRLAFAKLKNLVELDLSGNRQEFIPSHSFSQIPELRDLKMNSNPISRLSNDAFIDLGRLVRLELSGCRIGTIEAWAFRGLPALEWLRLDNNKLFTVQAISFSPLRSLHGLEIYGNPWNCSCALQPFREWMGKNNVPFGVPPVCSQPQRLVGKLWIELALEDFACLPKLSRTSGGVSSSNEQRSRKILEGENTTLTCQWEATPDTKVRWWNGNKPVGANGASGFSSGFLVSESFRWESGDPSVTRSGGSFSAGSSRRGTDSKSSVFSTASLSQGKHGRNQTSSSGGVGIKSSSLVVIRTTPRDAGTYSCKAESRAGSVTVNYTIIVVQNKTEQLTGRFLLFGAVLAALLTLVVSLLLVCVVFGSNRRHYQSSRISTDDKLELNHVGGTQLLGQNGGGSVPLMRNHHHNSHHYNHRQHPSNHSSIATTNVTTNSILSMRTMSNGENNCGSGGLSDKGRTEYKAVPTAEPDDSSSEIENNGSEPEDGEVDQDDSSPAEISTTRTTAVVVTSSGSEGKSLAREMTTTSTATYQNKQQPHSQQPSFSMSLKRKVASLQQCGKTKIGVVSGDTTSGRTSSYGHSGIPEGRNDLASDVSMGGGGGGGGAAGFSNSQSSSKQFCDKYPDLIDENMSLNSDFASLPRPNKNHQQKHPHQPYKHYSHQKQHLADTTRGYFHRRNNSDSQSPLLSRSYGNSTEKITSSGISILSSSSTESSYMSTYQAPPYTISQGHHYPPSGSQYGGGGNYKRSPATNFQHTQNQNPFMPNYSSTNYPTRQRLSMPTSPVHDHYFMDPSAPPVGALRQHSGSHDEGRGGLLSPTEPGISYVRTANSGPVGSASNVSYDYHAAQLAAFLEEYRQLQLELMRMSASLQQSGGPSSGGGSSTGNHQQQQGISSPPSDNSSLGNSNSISALVASTGPTHDISMNANNAGMLFKSSSTSHSNQGSSMQQQQQLKSILKNSGNNNNYVA